MAPAAGVDQPRFAFGENWQSFLQVVDDRRVAAAESSLRSFLEIDDLRGRSFLDLGCGSGLFSLAAQRLGADRVVSLDVDPASVAATTELQRRFAAHADNWSVERGDALDAAQLLGLGRFDVVYSWGVLHHTGNMWLALENVIASVADDGLLCIAIYNDQGMTSRLWRAVKQTCNRLPRWAQPAFVALVMAPRELRFAIAETLAGRPLGYVRSWTDYRRNRGMSRWHDLVDWVGGLPFEVAKPEHVFDLYRARGFELTRLSTSAGGLGCNQFVFHRVTSQRGR
jgi:SAM-dependent methyltransferase